MRKFFLKINPESEVINSCYAYNLEDAIEYFSVIKDMTNDALVKIFVVTEK